MYLCFCIHVPRSMCLLIYSSVHVQKILMCLSTLVKRTLLRPVSSHKCSNTVFNLQSWTIFPTITTKKHRCVIFNMYTCIPVCWVQPIWKIWVGLDHFPNFHGEYVFLFATWMVGHPDFGCRSLCRFWTWPLAHSMEQPVSLFWGDDESNWREREAFFFAKKML